MVGPQAALVEAQAGARETPAQPPPLLLQALVVPEVVRPQASLPWALQAVWDGRAGARQRLQQQQEQPQRQLRWRAVWRREAAIPWLVVVPVPVTSLPLLLAVRAWGQAAVPLCLQGVVLVPWAHLAAVVAKRAPAAVAVRVLLIAAGEGLPSLEEGHREAQAVGQEVRPAVVVAAGVLLRLMLHQPLAAPLEAVWAVAQAAACREGQAATQSQQQQQQPRWEWCRQRREAVPVPAALGVEVAALPQAARQQ